MTDEHNASTWPEQDVVDQWLEKHAIKVDFKQAMELKEAVTAPRIQVQEQLQAASAAQHKVHRWNIEPQPDDSLLVCRDLHEKGEPCEYEHYIQASAAPQPAQQEARQAREFAEWLNAYRDRPVAEVFHEIVQRYQQAAPAAVPDARRAALDEVMEALLAAGHAHAYEVVYALQQK